MAYSALLKVSLSVKSTIFHPLECLFLLIIHILRIVRVVAMFMFYFLTFITFSEFRQIVASFEILYDIYNPLSNLCF